MRSVISRFILDDVDSPGAGTVEQVIIEIDQFADNHNGGDIAFGADRMLYIGLGDGGGGGDPNETGQDTTKPPRLDAAYRRHWHRRRLRYPGR